MFTVGSFRILSNNQGSCYPGDMQSVSSSAYHKLSENSFYSAVPLPLALYCHSGMQSVQS